MREFTTSARTAESAPAGTPQPVKIDGREILLNPPDSNQLVLVLAVLESSKGDAALAATILNTFFSLIEEDEDAAFLRSRLFDSKDAFGLDTISEILREVLQEWSARPTQRSSGSSPSPQQHGSTSRGMHSGQAFHRGPSHSTAGAPSSNGGSDAVLRPTETP